MKETEIQDFWNRYPCGDLLMKGQLPKKANLSHYADFFDSYDKYRYSKESHILDCLDEISFRGKRVLEIGLRQGADSEQIIRRGGIWSGIDLTSESVRRVQIRLNLRGLSYETLREGSALSIPFEDNAFDIVFSHGVLHHIPDIRKAQSEIYRVLRPNGELIVMVYAAISLNYLLSICVLRRIGLIVLCALHLDPGGIYTQHLRNARLKGLAGYLRMRNFIHKSTDGPLNPYSKVYSKRTVQKDFPNFQLVKTHKHYMHAPPLPVSWLPLGKIMGWHLWCHFAPKK